MKKMLEGESKNVRTSSDPESDLEFLTGHKIELPKTWKDLVRALAGMFKRIEGHYGVGQEEVNPKKE